MYNTIEYLTIQYSAVHYSTLHYNTVHHNAVHTQTVPKLPMHPKFLNVILLCKVNKSSERSTPLLLAPYRGPFHGPLAP